MADVAVFGGETKKRIELGGLLFMAQPVTVNDWTELLSLQGDEQSAWMVKHLRERVLDATPDTITVEWYDRTVPYLEHQAVADALMGMLENHPTAKGTSVLRINPGWSEDTFSILGVRFMAALFTRAELKVYQALPKLSKAAHSDFFSACLRMRLPGSGIDPLTVTSEWYGGIPLPAHRYLEQILVKGVPKPEPEGDGKKKVT